MQSVGWNLKGELVAAVEKLPAANVVRHLEKFEHRRLVEMVEPRILSGEIPEAD
jgi:hypothetical protein